MKALRTVLPAVILLVFFASCSESSLFIPDLEETPDIAIETIEEGALVGLGEKIPLAIRYVEGARGVDDGDKSLAVLLFDVATGVELARTVLGTDDLMQPELPPIELSDMPTGLYRLELELSENGGVLATRRVEFFYVNGAYRVLGIATYPPAFFPSASGLLQANLDVPETADPYLRWTMGGEVIEEGTASSGAAEVILRSPDVAGVYPVTLELFPVAPPDRLDYDFSSPRSQTTDVYVTDDMKLEEWELGPEISYFTLFHFRGETKDTGVGAGRKGSSLRAQPVGDPDLRIHGEIFGYRLDGESGFVLDRVAVPFQDGRLAPFSINARVLLDTDDPGQTLLRTESADQSFALELSTAESGALSLRMNGSTGQSVSVSDSFLVPPDEPLVMTVSVFPLGDAGFVMWFRNGLLVGVSELPFWPDAIDASGGRTVIGGDSGFVGIVDELGVYFQNEQREPATYDEAFRDAMTKRYGDTLVYAEDFSGVTVPGELETEGDVRVLTGELLLQPGARVVFPRFLFAEEDLLVELDAEASSDGLVTISALLDQGDEYEEVSMFSISTAGELVEPTVDDTADEIERLDFRRAAGGLAFRLVHTEGSLELVGVDGDVAVGLDEAGFGGVVLALDSEAEAALPLRVMSLLVRRGQTAISRALTGAR